MLSSKIPLHQTPKQILQLLFTFSLPGAELLYLLHYCLNCDFYDWCDAHDFHSCSVFFMSIILITPIIAQTTYPKYLCIKLPNKFYFSFSLFSSSSFSMNCSWLFDESKFLVESVRSSRAILLRILLMWTELV